MTSDEGAEMGWYRVVVVSGAPEEDAEVLWALGAGGVEVQDEETFVPDAGPTGPGAGLVRLIGWFERGGDVEEACGALRAELEEAWCAAREAVDVAPFTDRGWETRWQEFFRPQRLSPRSVVGPPWESFEAPVEGGLKIVIEPGMAFGTGGHETTRLCGALLDEELARLAPHRPSLLDVGCGSGVLTILAWGLGARPVMGIDVDAEAVEIAAENLRQNGVPVGAGVGREEVVLSTRPVERIEGQYEVVVANILARILLQIAPGLRARVAPGGLLVMSGLLERDEEAIGASFLGEGWAVETRRQDGEWVSLAIRRGETR